MKRAFTPPERLMLGGAALFIVGAVVCFVLTLYVLAFWLLTVAFLYVMNVQASRNAYRMGWLRGRNALMLSMAEAQERGLSATEWIIAECERDGIPIQRSPIEPDDE